MSAARTFVVSADGVSLPLSEEQAEILNKLLGKYLRKKKKQKSP